MDNKYGVRQNYDTAQQLIREGIWRVEPIKGQILSARQRWNPIGSVRDDYVRVPIPIGNSKYRAVAAHRVIWEYVNGPSDLDLTINHIDGNSQNNSIYNLELIPNGDNIRLAYKTHLAGGRTKRPLCQYGHPFDGVYTDKKGYPHQTCSICSRLSVWGRNNGMTLAEAIEARPNGEPLPKVENPNCKYGHDKGGRKDCHVCMRIRARGRNRGLTFAESLQKWPDER